MLNCYGEAKDLDSLYITDFITVYGKDFGISEENLNGDNDFKYSEFQSRKVACRNALKELVLNGLALPLKEKDGILYCITEAGRECAVSARTYLNEYTNRQVVAMINKRSSNQTKGGINE